MSAVASRETTSSSRRAPSAGHHAGQPCRGDLLLESAALGTLADDGAANGVTPSDEQSAGVDEVPLTLVLLEAPDAQ